MEHFDETDARFRDPSTGFDTNRLLMEVYWEPLQAYYNASSFRRRDAESADVVTGFLAWYAERNYLQRWDSRTQRLRYFLLNGFKKYLLEEYRSERRNGRMVPLPEAMADESPPPEFDREYVLGVVHAALQRAEQACAQKKLTVHFQIFYRHIFEGSVYAEIAPDYGLSGVQAEGMAKAGRRRFREACLALLREQGLEGEELSAEVALYREILQR